MTLSFNEIEAMAAKAVRGAGLSWGLAEEAGFAARWLAERGLPWADAIVARCNGVLDRGLRLDQGVGMSGEELCPLRIGAFLADHGVPPEGFMIRDVGVPLLLLPFVARAAGTTCIQLALETGAAQPVSVIAFSDNAVYPDTPLAAWTRRAVAMFAVVTAPPQDSPLPVLARPLPTTPAQIQALYAFERQTYVPASAESRLAGAGAGLSDND